MPQHEQTEKAQETMNKNTETRTTPTPAAAADDAVNQFARACSYTNGFGYWYLAVQQARHARQAAAEAATNSTSKTDVV